MPRYAPLSIGGLQKVDYRSKTLSCSQCGSEAYLAVIEPIKEAGMQDYRLDAIEQPERHPTAVDRLTGGALERRPTTRAVSCRAARSIAAGKVLPLQLPAAYCIHRTRIDGERRPRPREARPFR
jgi:hypothetical protein